jgi:PAS domain S-box-containing protein
MYGWTREEALGQVSHKLLKTISSPTIADIEKHVIANGLWEGEMIHTTKGGVQLAIESKWTLTRTDRGVPQGFLEVNHDVTSRKRADTSLRDSEMRFRAVAETANEGIVTADDRGVMRYWNPGAMRMFGCTEQDAVGKHITIMMPERFRGRIPPASSDSSRPTRHAWSGARSKSSACAPTAASSRSRSRLVVPDVEGLFFSAMLRDITERKTGELRLQAKNASLRDRTRS